ncbi:MAG TPA: hypothetical protein DCO77_00555 [Nitrospiraceae bacterium]|nr:hypothetical protein [Nitrospiraceae bacterium]
MFRDLIRTENDEALTVLRVMLGIVIFPHGAQKLLGWFGGYGFNATMHWFTLQLGIPSPFAYLAILAEFFGALFLLFGFLTRIAAFGISCVMVVAVFMLHIHHGFFLNWSNRQGGEGIEFHLLVVAIGVVLMMRGGGKWSIDEMMN